MSFLAMRTTVRFLSHYRGISDYGITLAGTDEEQRVQVDAEGNVSMASVHGLSAAQETAYLTACLAHCRAERANAEAWAVAHAMSAHLAPARPLTPRPRLTAHDCAA